MNKTFMYTGLGLVAAITSTVALAYTPTDSTITKLDSAVNALENIIDDKGESTRSAIISLLSAYQTKYTNNEAALYVLNYLIEGIATWDTAITIMDGDYTGSYTISDSTYGTEVSIIVENGVRKITSNALPNHETGEFPNAANPNTISEQSKSWEFTTSPTYIGNETWASDNGVAVNGIKYQLETAERVTCESGEKYRVEAQQTVIDVIGLDFNNAHVQPTGEYHYHGVPTGLVDQLSWDDLIHVGFASDGFAIYYSANNSYSTSYQLVDEAREWTACTYQGRETMDIAIAWSTPDWTYDTDWEFVEGLGNLDACNGTYIDGEYVYFMTENFPYGPRCMNGEYSNAMGGWGWQWGNDQWPGGTTGERPEGGPGWERPEGDMPPMDK